MLQFHDKDIRAFQALLGSYKSTLAIALEFCTFKTSSENLDATRNLETKIEDLTARLTGQMQGLQIGLQTFLDSSATGHKSIIADDQRKLAEAQESRVLQAIEQRNTALKHCYRACMAVFKETTNVTGHTYKYMTASEESKFLMGDLGNVQGGAKHTYEKINATGKAWVVTGNMDGASAANFFK
ncbi:uncharacterized protein BDR25DRAFT_327960 [Lindgomyces ingoldianus]|uniref:Uncharacterized protein n=1 Tax=Lindgomyces ingoldianus TaxID=673940 RepID=A0ACB6QJU6_9PLEO|nr:uncharacterized protein BDR25DRAFT_327960 [Lindgomyces ingoldianus]KAF2466587.1 hypothetical protein BDR25DRAFT_327960 [Lindgomyces ingoldianus]